MTNFDRPSDHTEAEIEARLTGKRMCVECGRYVLSLEDMRCGECNTYECGEAEHPERAWAAGDPSDPDVEWIKEWIKAK